jgi:hypothetical protein
MPEQNTTPPPADAGREDESTPSPTYRVGDEIVFKYEGNVRATVEGYELVGGKVRLRARAQIVFLVPSSQVLAVDREG